MNFYLNQFIKRIIIKNCFFALNLLDSKATGMEIKTRILNNTHRRCNNAKGNNRFIQSSFLWRHSAYRQTLKFYVNLYPFCFIHLGFLPFIRCINFFLFYFLSQYDFLRTTHEYNAKIYCRYLTVCILWRNMYYRIYSKYNVRRNFTFPHRSFENKMNSIMHARANFLFNQHSKCFYFPHRKTVSR